VKTHSWHNLFFSGPVTAEEARCSPAVRQLCSAGRAPADTSRSKLRLCSNQSAHNWFAEPGLCLCRGWDDFPCLFPEHETAATFQRATWGLRRVGGLPRTHGTALPPGTGRPRRGRQRWGLLTHPCPTAGPRSSSQSSKESRFLLHTPPRGQHGSPCQECARIVGCKEKEK